MTRSSTNRSEGHIQSLTFLIKNQHRTSWKFTPSEQCCWRLTWANKTCSGKCLKKKFSGKGKTSSRMPKKRWTKGKSGVTRSITWKPCARIKCQAIGKTKKFAATKNPAGTAWRGFLGLKRKYQVRALGESTTHRSAFLIAFVFGPKGKNREKCCVVHG